MDVVASPVPEISAGFPKSKLTVEMVDAGLSDSVVLKNVDVSSMLSLVELFASSDDIEDAGMLLGLEEKVSVVVVEGNSAGEATWSILDVEDSSSLADDVLVVTIGLFCSLAVIEASSPLVVRTSLDDVAAISEVVVKISSSRVVDVGP